MIRIRLHKRVKSNVEKMHLEFFLNQRDIVNKLKNLQSNYESLSNQLLFNRLANARIDFIQYLINKIEKVLIGGPNDLVKIIEKANDLKVGLNKKNWITGRTVPTTFNNKLLEVFNYDDDFSNGPQSKSLGSSRLWTAYHLIDEIDVSVCPYCNRIYTNLFYSKNDGRTRPHLDHYYAKSLYPFLAISLYNLVPSCYVCNSNFKGNKDFYVTKHLHPYQNEMGLNIRFTLTPLKTEFDANGQKRMGYDLEFVKGKLEKFKIEIDDSKESSQNLIESWQKSDQTFHLLDLYQTHKNELHHLIQLSKVYKSEYTDWLANRYVGKIFSSKEEIKQMITGNYIDYKSFGKRPLAKLTYDISKELKLI